MPAPRRTDLAAVNSVEIKANIAGPVSEARHRIDCAAGPIRRRIWFAEDCDGLTAGELRLLSGGVIIRVRSGDGQDDTTVKLRPCEPTGLPPGWTHKIDAAEFEYRIEGDWSGSHHSVAASAVNTFGHGSQSQTAGAPLRKHALSDRQRFSRSAHQPRWRL